MKVSFVIPIYDHFPLINDLLVDIKNNCTPDEVVIVDDCSKDTATIDGIAWWARHYDDIKIVRPIENMHFLKASNYGVSKAAGDIICLISSDVKIEVDLAKLVRELIELDPKLLIGGIVYKHDTGWNTFEKTTYPYAEGWLLCCLKSAWEELGGFDEQYAPHDFEDVDLSTTAVSKGYTLISLDCPKIRHMGAQTIGYSETRSELTKANREKFKNKWITKLMTVTLPQTS